MREPTLETPEGHKQPFILHKSPPSPDSLPWAQETHRAGPKIWGKEVLRAYRCPEISSFPYQWWALSPQPSHRLQPGLRSHAFFAEPQHVPPLVSHSCWVPARWTGRGCLLRFVCALVPGMHLLSVRPTSSLPSRTSGSFQLEVSASSWSWAGCHGFSLSRGPTQDGSPGADPSVTDLRLLLHAALSPKPGGE